MFKEDKTLSRRWLANQHQHLSLHERLKKNRSVDLRDNRIIEDLGNGYNEIKPVNPNKRFN
jgi:hypothetical protein